jgi:hypothetical protein
MGGGKINISIFLDGVGRIGLPKKRIKKKVISDG